MTRVDGSDDNDGCRISVFAVEDDGEKINSCDDDDDDDDDDVEDDGWLVLGI